MAEMSIWESLQGVYKNLYENGRNEYMGISPRGYMGMYMRMAEMSIWESLQGVYKNPYENTGNGHRVARGWVRGMGVARDSLTVFPTALCTAKPEMSESIRQI